MRTFSYERVADVDAALDALRDPGTQVIAGGTELVNWLKEGIESPTRILDIGPLPLRGVERAGEGLRIGALARMSDVAAHPLVGASFPVLVQALLASASAQLRIMATIGGNLMQRTRCPYFRAEVELPCNKRRAGSGCSALRGDSRTAAIFGWSEHCVATHPSDLAVALAALDAVVVIRGAGGVRRVPVVQFERLPGDEPTRHTELRPGELIEAIEVPPISDASRSHYLKVRERVSYEFAVVSAAAVVTVASGRITDARLALGGVAHRPWRLYAAEAALPGLAIDDVDAFRAAVAESFRDARALPGNGHKVVLARRAAVRALQEAAA
jgi:xanthine dehydrogenase YagS FAD-binding subunit